MSRRRCDHPFCATRGLQGCGEFLEKKAPTHLSRHAIVLRALRPAEELMRLGVRNSLAAEYLALPNPEQHLLSSSIHLSSQFSPAGTQNEGRARISAPKASRGV
jgi:hypothetical protein